MRFIVKYSVVKTGCNMRKNQVKLQIKKTVKYLNGKKYTCMFVYNMLIIL